MNYHLKSSRRKKSSTKKIVIAIVAIVIFINLFKIDFVKTIVQKISTPIVSIFQSAEDPLRNTVTFESKKELQDKIDWLESELNLLQVRYQNLSYLEDENNILNEILGRKEKVSDLMIADVLVRPPQVPFDTMIINKGSNGGVSLGDRVYAFETFIGTVVSVSKSTSQIKLISSSGETFPVRISGEIDAEAHGRGGGRFVMTLPKDILVESGSVVSITDGYAPVLGVVQDSFEDEASTFQTLYFNFPFSLSSIRIVEIVHSLVEEAPTL